MSDITLSVIITSHNNEKQIERCLNSVLSQILDFSYEIIISDDSSIDNTIEIVKKYYNNYPNIISYYIIDTDEYNPFIKSERSAINKAHSYLKAKGKYIVYIDADDYLISNSIYNEQILKLEKHPECSLCMQNMLRIKDGETLEKSWFWGNNSLKESEILDFRTYIENQYCISNPAFMMRRDITLNPFELYNNGKLFNDEFITMHHLTCGNIIYIDRNDYMYVQYNTSIDMSYEFDDKIARYALLPMLYSLIFPTYSTSFIKGYRYKISSYLKKIDDNNLKLTENMKLFLRQFNGYLFSYLSNTNHSFIDKIHFKTLRIMIILINKFNINNRYVYILFQRMM